MNVVLECSLNFQYFCFQFLVHLLRLNRSCNFSHIKHEYKMCNRAYFEIDNIKCNIISF